MKHILEPIPLGKELTLFALQKYTEINFVEN